MVKLHSGYNRSRWDQPRDPNRAIFSQTVRWLLLLISSSSSPAAQAMLAHTADDFTDYVSLDENSAKDRILLFPASFLSRENLLEPDSFFILITPLLP